MSANKSVLKLYLVRIFAVIIFLGGCLLFLYPYLTEKYAKYQSDKVIKQFEKDLVDLKNAAKYTNSDFINGDMSNNHKVDMEMARQLSRLYEDMNKYNEELVLNGQDGIKDPFLYETPSFDLKEYGFTNNVVGIIEIPVINEKLPMYLGASKENMKRGAVVLGGTSMPTGKVDTNVAIAAHRGYKGIPMFRNIQNISIGDEILITTPWEDLKYYVSEIKIVNPEESSSIKIRQGESLITLITCHPYTKNTQRYLVIAKKSGIENTNSENNINSENVSENNINSENVSYDNINTNNIGEDDANNNKNSSDELSKKESERILKLEKYVPIVGIIIVLLLIVFGIIITRKKDEKNG